MDTDTKKYNDMGTQTAMTMEQLGAMDGLILIVLKVVFDLISLKVLGKLGWSYVKDGLLLVVGKLKTVMPIYGHYYKSHLYKAHFTIQDDGKNDSWLDTVNLIKEKSSGSCRLKTKDMRYQEKVEWIPWILKSGTTHLTEKSPKQTTAESGNNSPKRTSNSMGSSKEKKRKEIKLSLASNSEDYIGPEFEVEIPSNLNIQIPSPTRTEVKTHGTDTDMSIQENLKEVSYMSSKKYCGF